MVANRKQITGRESMLGGELQELVLLAVDFEKFGVNERIKWHLRNLNRRVHIPGEGVLVELSHSLTVPAIVGGVLKSTSPDRVRLGLLVPDSTVLFMYLKYRAVIVLDVRCVLA